MAQLTADQIRTLAQNAGFTGSALDIAVAVALAESGGNTNSYNPETAAGTAAGSGSRGLWQIYGSAHPEYNNDAVLDPAANAAAAYKVYQEAGNSFTPWSTFNNGAINQFLSNLGDLYAGGVAAAGSAATSAATGAAAGTLAGADWKIGLLGPIAPTVDVLNKVSAAISNPANIKKVGTDAGFIAGGVFLFFVGLILIFYANRETMADGAKVLGTVAAGGV